VWVAKTVPTTCGAGCVNDGSLYFGTDRLMRKIEDRIRQANADARSDGLYKTIVLLDPLTYSPGGTVSQARITDELAGALLAQQMVNGQAQAANKHAKHAVRPSVQVLLADEGTSAEEGAAQAIAQVGARQVPDHIVAVAGMGLSIAATQAAAMVLAGDHLPMFGAVTTGDEFNGVSFPGFYQVVPDVEAQVQALLAVTVTQGKHVALIGSDQPADIYSGDLHTDFTTAVQSGATLADYPFDPASDPAAAGKVFADEASSVCGQPGKPSGTTPRDPRIVLYAGRAAALPALIQVFQESAACASQYVTIVTGSDANGLPATATLPPGIGGATVTIEYSDIEDVSHLSPTFTSGYTSLVRAAAGPGTTSAPCPNQRYDPWAVATYDAVMAAATVPLPTSSPPATTPAPTTTITGAAASFKFSATGQLDAPTRAIPLYQDVGGHCLPRPAGGR
jgi:hypothetical protein